MSPSSVNSTNRYFDNHHDWTGDQAPCDEELYLDSLPEIHTTTTVQEDSRLGRSVFASVTIPACCLLGVYPGEHKTVDNFYSRDESVLPALRYAYYLSEEIIIDPCNSRGELPRCDKLRLAMVNEPPPGKDVNVIAISSSKHAWYVSIRRIAAGEEIFTSYGANYPRDYASELKQKNGHWTLTTADRQNLEILGQRYPWLRRGANKLL